jgi:hypothetical protein
MQDASEKFGEWAKIQKQKMYSPIFRRILISVTNKYSNKFVYSNYLHSICPSISEKLNNSIALLIKF